MTVIAWDGHTLAADRRAVSGGGIARTVTKIERWGHEMLAVTGQLDVGSELREWYKAGASPKDFPQSAREADATLIVISRHGGIREYVSGPYPMLIDGQKAAWGSGRDYAEAAMHLGHDAVKGVEVACAFQTDCGGGIDTLTLSGQP